MNRCIFEDEYRDMGACFTLCSIDYYNSKTINECKKCDRYMSMKNGRKALLIMTDKGLIKYDEN